MQLKKIMSFESESINENVFFVKGNVHCFGNPRRKRILFALDKFRKLDLRIEENKERLIDGLVKAIIVYDDHFEVFLTFDDTLITIPTSEEIESMKNSSDIASVTSPKKTNPNCFANRNRFGFVFCFQNKTISPQKQPSGCFCGDVLIVYTLNRNRTISPSCMTYSLPSLRSTPASRAADIEPYFFRSSNASTSARMKPRSISE